MLSHFYFEVPLVFAYMTFFFVLSRVLGRNDVADVAWGVGFIVVAAQAFLSKASHSVEDFLFFSFAAVWALRLSVFIYLRNRGKPEDMRYQNMKKNWGSRTALKSFLIVFMLQGFLLILNSTPLVYGILSTSKRLNFVFAFGVFIWFIGFMIEAVADIQKSRFKANPQNRSRVMRSGLWKYSRHPNYFGEIVVWLGFYVMALSDSSLWWTIVGPLTITFLLTKVSGVPMIEAYYKDRPEFAEYRRTTNSLFLWPPRK